jgi:hypothetical protein
MSLRSLFAHRAASLIAGLATFVIAMTFAIVSFGSRPSVPLVAVAIASALAVAIIVGSALRPKSPYVRSREDVERALKLPVLATYQTHPDR